MFVSPMFLKTGHHWASWFNMIHMRVTVTGPLAQFRAGALLHFTQIYVDACSPECLILCQGPLLIFIFHWHCGDKPAWFTGRMKWKLWFRSRKMGANGDGNAEEFYGISTDSIIWWWLGNGVWKNQHKKHIFIPDFYKSLVVLGKLGLDRTEVSQLMMVKEEWNCNSTQWS